MRRVLFAKFGLLLLAVLSLIILQSDFLSAENLRAPLTSRQTDCEGAGGSWVGSSDELGTCTYPSNSAYAISNCGPDHIYKETSHLEVFLCVSVKSSVKPSVVSLPQEPEPEIGSKCKLVDIDRIFNVGGTFEAEWIGIMESIRFRQPGAGLEFITWVPGTLIFTLVDPEDDHLYRSAQFQNGFTLDRGRWEATCWGPEGTFGTAFIVNVK